jgi:DegV family protein with EDD domain
VNLTADNTAVVLDSTADFPHAPKLHPNFSIVPLYVRFGDESLKDYVEISPTRFYERLAAAPSLPTTSQPTPADFLAAFEELAPRYERIIVLPISSTLSGTFRSAEAAAGMLGGDKVRVIDSRTVSASLALLALGVQRRLERGTTDEEIDEFVKTYARGHRLLFTVNTLDYLAKGGRIGKAAAFAGNLLNVKPILTIRDGEVVPLKRVRGNQKAFAEFQRLFESTSTDSPSLKVGIAHAAAPERMQALWKMVRSLRPRAEIEIQTTLGAVVGTHAGPGTVGFFWFDDSV